MNLVEGKLAACVVEVEHKICVVTVRRLFGRQRVPFKTDPNKDLRGAV